MDFIFPRKTFGFNLLFFFNATLIRSYVKDKINAFVHLAENHKRYVPESCCAPGDVKICTGETEFGGPPMYFNGHSPEFRRKNPYLYTEVSDGLLYLCFGGDSSFYTNLPEKAQLEFNLCILTRLPKVNKATAIEVLQMLNDKSCV